jgi:hypothetical protein
VLKDKQKTLRPNKEFQVYTITIPVHDITICEDIFCELEKILEKYELLLNKFICLVVGDSLEMMHSKKDVIPKLIENLAVSSELSLHNLM